MHLIERIFLQSSAANPNTSLSDSESDFNYDDGGGGGGGVDAQTQQLAVAAGQQNSGQQQQIIYAQHNRSRNYRSDTSSQHSNNTEDQTTPTEVFSVSALYVTWPKEAGLKCQKSKPRPAKKLML